MLYKLIYIQKDRANNYTLIYYLTYYSYLPMYLLVRL